MMNVENRIRARLHVPFAHAINCQFRPAGGFSLDETVSGQHQYAAAVDYRLLQLSLANEWWLHDTWAAGTRLRAARLVDKRSTAYFPSIHFAQWRLPDGRLWQKEFAWG